MGKVFYKEGLNFKCREGCAICCGQTPGYVFLSEEDIERLMKATSLPREQFLLVYTRKVKLDNGEEAISLKEYSNNDCLFLGNGKCTVYDSRPTQCRTYPFWKRIVESQETWDKETEMCPGINDKSGFVSVKEIEEMLFLQKI